MKALKHILQQPFVAATGLAALVHSTWALGTLFAGEQPDGWHLLGWLLPALLIAFALDVGQISTSAEIREHGLTWTRGITFVVFAGATYYLQWLYIAHHMPALALAPGVRETWSDFATVMRDAAVWVIPALLPLSTLLYTFSGGKTAAGEGGANVINIRQEPNEIRVQRPVETPMPPLLEVQQSSDSGSIVHQDGAYVATFGEWSKTYPTEASAQRGLSGYISRLRYKQKIGQFAQEGESQ